MAIDKIASAIHKDLAEINSEAMYGLHHRSKDIEAQVASSGETIKQLKAQADEAAMMNDKLHFDLQEQRKEFSIYIQRVKRE
jgi:hypothetical protein